MAVTERVLIVDNDAQSARLAALVAIRNGYAVEVAAGGLEAISRVSAAPDEYACVITDNGMTPVTGIQVGAAIRSNPRARHINIVLLSGDRDIANIFDTSGLFDAYLGKPYEFDDLVRVLRAFGGSLSEVAHCFNCGRDIFESPDVPDRELLLAHMRRCLRPRQPEAEASVLHHRSIEVVPETPSFAKERREIGERRSGVHSSTRFGRPRTSDPRVVWMTLVGALILACVLATLTSC